MNTNTWIAAMDHLDGDLIEAYFKTEGALEMKKTKKKTSFWLKWGTLVACLCLVIVGGILFLFNRYDGGYAHELAQVVNLNDVEYVICGTGEESILEELGLPKTPAFYHAGERLTYLTFDGDHSYLAIDGKSDVILYEYAPNPNELVYVVKSDGHYYFAIRWDKIFPYDSREDLGL